MTHTDSPGHAGLEPADPGQADPGQASPGQASPGRDRRRIGPFTVGPIGFGCMNLSHAYGVPPAADDARRLLEVCLDLGVDHFDTAALYGFGANEELVGRTLAPHRHRILLASKGGLFGVKGEQGMRRVLDGRPQTLKTNCEESLKRLGTDVIDLYYLHRWDKSVAVEESIGALVDLKQAGKIRAIGLSEVSADTLKRAQAIHPIAAVQSEYSLWTREPEISVLAACERLGVAFVAFSPLARGFLTDRPPDPTTLPKGDLRTFMPRFQGETYSKNRLLLQALQQVASEGRITLPQLALNWILAQSPNAVVIPGTTDEGHLRDNMAAASFSITSDLLVRAGAIVNELTVVGERYSPATQKEIDTEEFTATTRRTKR